MRSRFIALLVFSMAAVVAAVTIGAASGAASESDSPAAVLIGRAVLPAQTFAPGPTSGAQLGAVPINGVTPPFIDKQPVQGFSAILPEGKGRYLAMVDNGFGALENSSDANLRVYTIKLHLERASGGSGVIEVEKFFELRDPSKRVPFAITNSFSRARVLTGADFDIESMQRAKDGTLWFGDEFGPFLIHTDARGTVLEAPYELPDPDNPGKQLRSPQNPLSEEASAVRIMNAVRAQARSHGALRAPVFSPSYQLLDDGDSANVVANRANPPAGSGLAAASSKIFNVASIKAAGYPVVPYTVDDAPRMTALLALKVDGIISDRPDLLYATIKAYDANGDGTAGDFIGPDGLIDATKVDAQGHRGGRDLRPENTLPAMEAGLDALMTTLETDTGITKDGVPVLNHDPHVQAQKCRRSDGKEYEAPAETLVRDIKLRDLQATFICDRLFRGPTQLNDRALSPVAVAFAGMRGFDPYAMPSLDQLFDFVDFYVGYYRDGAGKGAPDAAMRWHNAARVRFNIETKINPRVDEDPRGMPYNQRTFGVEKFVTAVAGLIAKRGLEARADVQSFDFRTLLRTQERFPKIRTVYLFGDFPTYADQSIAGSDDGTNLQPQGSANNTPWLAGLRWPYRVTVLQNAFRAQRSGGLEGMARSDDRRTLLPLLEKPLVGADPKTLLMLVFDLGTKQFTGDDRHYTLDARGTSIGDFQMVDATHGVVIERDDSMGTITGFKRIYEVTLGGPGSTAVKRDTVDLQQIADPYGISPPAAAGDVGIGDPFSFPFTTIEDVAVLEPGVIAVMNDNNFPFSVGRHAGSLRPDDEEFIVLRLARPLALA